MGFMLYILSGLPGVGKTTLSKMLATRIGGMYLRIDSVEQALRDLCHTDVQGEGYRLSYRVAADNLKLGLSVVADSCNPIELTRREWQDVAQNCGVDYRNIEVICSDINEHRSRVENRKTDIQHQKLPTWEAVVKREYQPWSEARLVIDTANQTPTESFSGLMNALSDWQL